MPGMMVKPPSRLEAAVGNAQLGQQGLVRVGPAAMRSSCWGAAIVARDSVPSMKSRVSGQVGEGEPQCGMWRTRHQVGEDDPVLERIRGTLIR